MKLCRKPEHIIMLRHTYDTQIQCQLYHRLSKLCSSDNLWLYPFFMEWINAVKHNSLGHQSLIVNTSVLCRRNVRALLTERPCFVRRTPMFCPQNVHALSVHQCIICCLPSNLEFATLDPQILLGNSVDFVSIEEGPGSGRNV